MKFYTKITGAKVEEFGVLAGKHSLARLTGWLVQETFSEAFFCFSVYEVYQKNKILVNSFS